MGVFGLGSVYLNCCLTGLNAPLATVERYGTTELDTWKVQAAMTTELGYGVGNITAALQAAGMWENTILVLVSDNGGPWDHTANWPLRAGKGTEFEGGYRVTGFIASPLLPKERHGTNFSGMMHSAGLCVALRQAAVC